MGLGRGEEGVVVCVTSGKILDDETRECTGPMNTVIFCLCGTRVVQLEVGEVRGGVASDAVSDLACG
jgi:hypothetical protein